MNNTIKGVTLLFACFASMVMAQTSRHLQESVSKSPMVSSHTQSQSAVAKPSVSSSTSTIKKTDVVESKIVSYIQYRQPNKGLKYAQKIGGYIIEAANEFHIDPFMLATTADIESTYDMKSKPQQGIMQFTRGTGRTYEKMGFNLKNPRDNIRAGACKLSFHYYAYSSRGHGNSMASRGGWSRSGRGSVRWEPAHGAMSENALRSMWGAYNGCGPRGGYVRASISRYKTIRNWTNPKTKPSSKHKKPKN